MQPGNDIDRRKKIITFSLILIATAIIASLLLSSLWQKEDVPVAKADITRQSFASTARYNKLFSGNDALSARLNSLHLLDQRYASLLTDPGNKKALDSVNQQIYVQEEFFRGSIDSAFLSAPDQSDSGLNKLFNDMIKNYRSILENRSSVSSLRNAVSMDKTAMDPAEIAMLKNKNELQEKANKIATLEGTIKAMAAKVPVQSTEGTDNIATLKENITEQENKIAALTATTNNLKLERDKLLKQQNDVARNSTANESTNKNKIVSMQQRLDELNAELRLAQVDCNLSRVDASQIISTSKQRKQLLSEASGILTNLSNTDDASIKKKVQDKIVRLNQVAANTRD